MGGRRVAGAAYGGACVRALSMFAQMEERVQVHRNDPQNPRTQSPLIPPGRDRANTPDAPAAEPAAWAGDRAGSHGVPAGAARTERAAEVTEPGYEGAGRFRIANSTGLLVGVLLVLLGIWGAIVPFVGPYFGYGLGYAGPWYFSLGRLWLDVLPGIAVLLGGMVLAASRNRALAWPAACLALAGGIWFVVGSQISRLWTAGGGTAVGTVTGAVGHQVAQYMGYFFGLGAVISVLAALAAGRLAVRGVSDVRAGLAARAR